MSESRVTDRNVIEARCLLGLMPSGTGWEERATYLAFLLLHPELDRREAIAEARQRLEEARPGFLEDVQHWVRDAMKAEKTAA